MLLVISNDDVVDDVDDDDGEVDDDFTQRFSNRLKIANDAQ